MSIAVMLLAAGRIANPMPDAFQLKCVGWSLPDPGKEPEPRFFFVCKRCPRGPYFPVGSDGEHLLRAHAQEHRNGAAS